MSNVTQPASRPQTHTAALKQWIDAERQKGLIDLKFFPRDTASSTEESLAAEVLKMINADTLSHEGFY